MNQLSEPKISQILRLADAMEKGKRYTRKGAFVLFFEKPSTRTMLSFEIAATQLGYNPFYLEAITSQVSRGETMADTARVISSYADVIAARLNRHADLITMAEKASIPVINALTDLEHPTQALTDIYTISKIKHKLKGLRLAFVGDIAANTANSLMAACAMMGMNISLVGPKGYPPNSRYVALARKYSSVEIHNDIKKGVSAADVVYTDTFVSMGEEAEAKKRIRQFSPYQVNSKLLSYAKSDAIVMHCLPAHRGQEITSEVLDGKQSAAWIQAKNKLVVEKAVIVFVTGR